MAERLATLTPDPLDARDYLYEFDQFDLLPTTAGVDGFVLSVPNQLSISSCTANAVTNFGELFLKANGIALELSRLFNYYDSRESIGWLGQDLGSTVRAALKSANKRGLPTEAIWPYDPALLEARPAEAAYADALTRQLGGYFRIEQPNSSNWYIDVTRGMRHALASGYAVPIGMEVGEKLRTWDSLEAYPPTGPTNPSIGGHAMLVVRYDDERQAFLALNSWDDEWNPAMRGYFWCSYSAVRVNIMDVWVGKGFDGFDRCGTNTVIRQPVSLMYEQALHRFPDPAGFAYWSTQTPRIAMTGICSSAEFYAINTTVADLYRAILGREPDAAGLAYWMGTGLSIASVTAEFLKSQEFNEKY